MNCLFDEIYLADELEFSVQSEDLSVGVVLQLNPVGQRGRKELNHRNYLVFILLWAYLGCERCLCSS
jgi:hypothetical protein